MTSKTESRLYPFVDRNGRAAQWRVTYTLWFNNDTLEDVRNEYGHSVEKQSECWEYFDNKYN